MSAPTLSATRELTTERLPLRRRQSALDVYGHPEVTHWLSPDMDRVPDIAAMRLLLRRWIAEDAQLPGPAGRWTIPRNTDGRVIGGAILLPFAARPR